MSHGSKRSKGLDRVRASVREPVGGDRMVRASASEPVGGDRTVRASASGDETVRARAAQIDVRAGGQRSDPEQRIDELQRLWTPWRNAYVTDPDASSQGCPFCHLPGRGAAHDAESLILHRGTVAFVILNAYPYNPGHLMIVPYRHTDDYVSLSDAEVHEMAILTQRAVRVLRRTSGAHAFNIGLNLGGIAGAGIADHVHQHVVPRWGGDTNFMPVIGQTRVLPELLDETWARIAPAFADG
ncbi:MAG TPA: HIT domain-containing protein [Euzebyales bacterium]|nr:HIT domain-containing protein [Euzebyales bacterium]